MIPHRRQEGKGFYQFYILLHTLVFSCRLNYGRSQYEGKRQEFILTNYLFPVTNHQSPIIIKFKL
ncbi:hypothetical protein H6F45_22185 [Sphaerospermopsis sp. FACHB-1194]|nr:hypothetical protein [Sphaerospermopsis sp. FACHB-1194]